MPISPFHAIYKAKMLSSYAFGKDKLVPVFASSDMKIYPYQIAAAQFAMRSPYLKGVILCDEGSLGKTYEALLVIVQSYYEGKNKILMVVPTPLLKQWSDTISEHFTVSYFTIDSDETFFASQNDGQDNPFNQDGIILTTYDFAAEKTEYIKKINWQLSAFDEAHRLRKIYAESNKEANILHEAVGDSFKLLLTTTPMQNDIMDLFGLIYFIDETVFPDADAFYKRYFRKPENYPELAERVSKYCFRTTRKQVQNYVKIPKRIPVTVSYTPSGKEKLLCELLDAYLKKPEKHAYPKMEQYDLTLLLCRTLSSSTFAFSKTLQAAVKRVECGEWRVELEELRKMLDLCDSITENAKGKELLNAIKIGFVQLKKRGAKQKALIFTENKATLKFLDNLLSEKYKTLTYSGDKSRDYSVMSRFRDEAQILITTDIASEGFDLEFCSYIINYDLPYNTLTIEQRINRCHRQGQQNDVVVLSFFNQNNFADVRMLELINKRTLQFDGIIGLSDHVIGNFNTSYDEAFEMTLTRDEIEAAFNAVLTENESDNKQLVESAEDKLFTSFSKNVAQSVAVVPQYIKDKTAEINDDLWFVTKYFFDGTQIKTDDKTRTITTNALFGQAPKIFTGAKIGRNEYSMAPDYKPKSGRYTITCSLARNVIKELFWRGIPDTGTVELGDRSEELGVDFPCTVAFYEIKVKPKAMFWGGYSYYAFVGKTASGRIMTNEECRTVMNMPVLSFTKGTEVFGERDGLTKQKPPNELDSLIRVEEYIQKTVSETESAEKEEIERLKQQTVYKKSALEHKLDELRTAVAAAE